MASVLRVLAAMTASAHQLDRLLARGIAWTGGIKWVTSLLTWGVTLLVVRELSPADYGLFGMAMVFIGFAQLASEAGLLATIVQAPTLSEPHAARLGGLALMMAVAIAAVSMGISSLLAVFFREPAVQWMVMALSVTFILRGVQVLRRGLLTRALRFDQIAWIDAAEAISMSISTLAYALIGWSYWALVGGVLTGVTVGTVLSVILAPHAVRLPRHVREFAGSVGFGAQVFGGQVAWYAYTAADFVVVGRMLGATALGAYTFAWVIAGLAVERIAGLMGRVVPAIFSQVQTDPAALRRYVCRLTEGLALVTMPVCIGIALVADLVVTVGLGDAWLAAITPMRLLAVYAAVRCLAVILPQLLVFTGHAKQSMHFNLIALCVLPPLFIAGAAWGGITGVSWAWLIAYPLLMWFTYLRYLRQAIALSLGDYLASLRSAVGATTVMAVAVLAARALLPSDLGPLPTLMVLSATGALAYGAVIVTLHRHRFADVLRLLRATDVPAGATPILPARTVGRGRLLLISYHFPPDPAIGSLRWQKFARFAAERGWGLDVIMRDERSIPIPDSERLADLPPGVRRFGVPDRGIWFDRIEEWIARVVRSVIPRNPSEESVAASAVGMPRSGRDLARAYFALADHLRHRRWARDAARAALKIAQCDVHRVVIGCGPPCGAYIAARRVARATQLPMVMDMRDPWSLSQRWSESIASPVAIALSRFTERRTIDAAALVVTNSAAVGEAMRQLYAAHAARIIDVPNGFDDDLLPEPTPRERFVLAYAGTIYLNRDPRPLFQAMAIVVRDLALTPAEFGLELLGDVENANGVPLARLAEEAGVSEFVRMLPTRPRSEALEYLAGASVLVLLPQDSDMVIPGKIYEYMRFNTWILALAEPQSAVACLLRGSAADVVSAGDTPTIAAVLARRYRQYQAGERGTPVAVDRRFSRRARADRFFGALDGIVCGPRREDSPQPLQQRRLWVAPPADLGAVAAERHP